MTGDVTVETIMAPEVAGFALVRHDHSDGHREVGEIYVVDRWRRQGIGSAFARQLLARYPGPWKLHALADNRGAVAFWRRALSGLVAYTEAPLAYPDGLARIEQRFVVSRKGAIGYMVQQKPGRRRA
jgi:predicted acetyltransferase